MAYATLQQLTERLGETALKQLAPLAGQAGAMDTVRIQRALDDASAELDSYLAVRFPVPVSGDLPLLVKATCELAQEDLSRAPSDAVVAAAKRAREWARAVAQGKATLGSGPAGEPDAVPTAGGGAQAIAPDPVFDADGLRGYLR